MKALLLRWLARYDAWCLEWGLTPENRRCCAPVLYDEGDPRRQKARRDVPDKGDELQPADTRRSTST